MDTEFIFHEDLSQLVEVPENGILSRTLQNSERSKVVLFGFAPGQELTAHTAPMPAVIHLLEGEARLTLGAETREASAGAWAYMEPQLEHGIYAKTRVVMLLTMIKGK
jgi:quercetin dioxygenase-like cupin family protein